MTKTVLIASNNAHKVAEISDALAFTGWHFVSLKEAGIISDPEETGTTFRLFQYLYLEIPKKNGKTELAAGLQNICLAASKQGAGDHGVLKSLKRTGRRNAAKARRAAAPRQMQQHRFQIVVGMMRRDEQGNMVFGHHVGKKVVADGASDRFDRLAALLCQRGHVGVKNEDRQAVFVGQRAAELLVAISLRSTDAVVNVRYVQWCSALFTFFGQKMQK